MAAKLLQSLTDERRQVGCMTGFIHLFDPIQSAHAKRITDGRSRMRLQGESQFCQAVLEVDQPGSNPYLLQHPSEMRSNRNSSERLGVYTESSRASCSSSRSSSFSSLDYSKAMHPDPSSYDRIIFPGSPLLDRSLSHSSSSWRMRQQSLDLDDEEPAALLKDQDALRPLEPMKVGVGGQNVLSELKESPGAPPKVGSLCLYDEGRLASRLSCELKAGQHYRRGTTETLENCASLNELAKLSLDSRECSVMRHSGGLRAPHHNQRPPSIVEKLMGLEAMPGKKNSDGFVQIGQRRDAVTISKFTTLANPPQESVAQRCSRKDPTPPHKWRNGDLVMKPISSSSRIPIELAPWKPKPVVRSKQGSATDSNRFPFVHSELQRRLDDIEFQHSAKDLRALKQMLDAAQQKGSWRTENEVVSGNGVTIDHQDPDSSKIAKLQKPQNVFRGAANVSQEKCLTTLRSPIVIMKPVKLVEKSDIAASKVIRSEGARHLRKPHPGNSAAKRKALPLNTQMVKHQNPRCSYQSPGASPSEKKPPRTFPAKPQQLLNEKNAKAAVSAGSASQRQQQKKFELEKKPQTATTSYDVTKTSAPKSRQPRHSCERPRPKAALIQQYDAQQSSGVSSEPKDTSHSEDDTEVTSKLRLDPMYGGRSPARKAARQLFSGVRKNKPCQRSSENAPQAQLAFIAPDQPSPVSVLDPSVHRANPPLKKPASDPTDIATGISSVSENAAGFTANMSREKLKHVEELVEKLRGLSSGSAQAESIAEPIASPGESSRSPDETYISKILLASGFLLRDLAPTGSSSFQPHLSGHPINPDLFLVLEQTKSTGGCRSKPHRKLIFDLVNEILAKLILPSGVSGDSQPVPPRKLAKNTVTARWLLRDLCGQIERMQARSGQEEAEEGRDEGGRDGLKGMLFEDVMRRSEKWTSFERSVPEVVLDVERMLFKDLVKEVVSDEGLAAALQQSKGVGSCDRKLSLNTMLCV
uniref:DUF4378 domain-containing protein n=1 Tax=Kalanchoe fedtschenkoi TaxID=63787 RepID=A0A7N0TWM2_KALFE